MTTDAIQNFSWQSHMGEIALDLPGRVGVVAVYLLIIILHILEMPLALLVLNIDRFFLHTAAVKSAAFALYTYFTPKGSQLAVDFRLHHLSYGLAALLVPGAMTRFGKWMICCSLFNYDQGKYFQNHNDIDPKKGNLELSSSQSFFEGATFLSRQDRRVDGILSQVGGGIFPADNRLKRDWADILVEFIPFTGTPILDEISGKINEILDTCIFPTLQTGLVAQTGTVGFSNAELDALYC